MAWTKYEVRKHYYGELHELRYIVNHSKTITTAVGSAPNETVGEIQRQRMQRAEGVLRFDADGRAL